MIKCKVRLVDVHLQNVCMLLQSTCKFGHLLDVSNFVVTRSPRLYLNTCVSIAAAHILFRNKLGRTHFRLNASSNAARYLSLVETEMPGFKAYLCERFTRQGVCAETVLQNMTSIPSSVNSHLRTFMLQWLLNGLPTSRRVRHFIDLDDVPSCYLCGESFDSLEHLTQCRFTCELADHVIHQPGSNIAFWTPQKSSFSCVMQGSEIVAGLQMNFAIWRARTMQALGHRFRDDDDLKRFLIRACTDSRYIYNDARRRRVVPPEAVPVDSTHYRSDGAARGQGTDNASGAGFGCICYAFGDEPEGWIHKPLGSETTNNVAEYSGLICILERIMRMPVRDNVIEVDSLLVSKQATAQWRCRNQDLQPYFDRCWTLIEAARQARKGIDIRHIYREFNADADALANKGADGLDDSRNW